MFTRDVHGSVWDFRWHTLRHFGIISRMKVFSKTLLDLVKETASLRGGVREATASTTRISLLVASLLFDAQIRLRADGLMISSPELTRPLLLQNHASLYVFLFLLIVELFAARCSMRDL